MAHSRLSCDRHEIDELPHDKNAVIANPTLGFETDTSEIVPPQIDREWLTKLIAKHRRHDDEGRPMTTSNDDANKIFALAPMVEQSDRPFRLLCREYGTNLTYTPMIHASFYLRKPIYRRRMFSKTPASVVDRPLIVQIAGRNKTTLLEAARRIVDEGDGTVDAIDLNLGCPTLTARRGGYGAWLLGSGSFVVDIVWHLVIHLSPVPVTVKVRLLPGGNLEDSLSLYDRLVDAGIAAMAVHGRTMFQKGAETGRADWDALKVVVGRYSSRIPVLVNGGVGTREDVRDILRYTGADGVLSAESILEYPALFSNEVEDEVGGVIGGDGDGRVYYRNGPGRVALAKEYLLLAKKYPPEEGGGGYALRCVRMHLETMLHCDWRQHPDLEVFLRQATDEKMLWELVEEVKRRQCENGHEVREERLSWYMRHR